MLLVLRDRQSSFMAGSKNSPYLRLLPPAYADGVFLPRCFHLPLIISPQNSLFDQFFLQGRESATEPGARLQELSSLTARNNGHNNEVRPPKVLSFNEHSFREGDQNETESKTNTHMVMQWGQVSTLVTLLLTRNHYKIHPDFAPSSLTTTSSPPAKQPLTVAIQKSSESRL